MCHQFTDNLAYYEICWYFVARIIKHKVYLQIEVRIRCLDQPKWSDCNMWNNVICVICDFYVLYYSYIFIKCTYKFLFLEKEFLFFLPIFSAN